jgi:hypothetical protein
MVLIADGLAPQSYGIGINMIPGDPAFQVELQRAPDSGGSPGAFATITTLPPMPAAMTYVDILPHDNAFRHYRWRHIGPGYDPSANWSAIGRGKPARLEGPAAEGGLISLYPIVRGRPLSDGKFALQATEIDGSTKSSSAHNPQASIIPTPADPTILLYKAAGPATGRMYGILRRLSSYVFRRPDGSTLTAPATNAYSRPAQPTLSQVVAGALGARTRWVRVFYLKFMPRSGNNIWVIYRTSIEQSISLSANNLLKVTAPPTVTGYDRWGLMVGPTSNNELFQRSSVDAVPFGTDWTEPVGGADLTNGSPYDAQMDDGLTIEGLTASTNYQLYVFFDSTVDTPAGGVFRIGANAGGAPPAGIDTAAAADQNGDGMIPLSFGVSVVLPVPVGAGSNSGNGAGNPKYQ